MQGRSVAEMVTAKVTADFKPEDIKKIFSDILKSEGPGFKYRYRYDFVISLMGNLLAKLEKAPEQTSDQHQARVLFKPAEQNAGLAADSVILRHMPKTLRQEWDEKTPDRSESDMQTLLTFLNSTVQPANLQISTLVKPGTCYHAMLQEFFDLFFEFLPQVPEVAPSLLQSSSDKDKAPGEETIQKPKILEMKSTAEPDDKSKDEGIWSILLPRMKKVDYDSSEDEAEYSSDEAGSSDEEDHTSLTKFKNPIAPMAQLLTRNPEKLPQILSAILINIHKMNIYDALLAIKKLDLGQDATSPKKVEAIKAILKNICLPSSKEHQVKLKDLLQFIEQLKSLIDANDHEQVIQLVTQYNNKSCSERPISEPNHILSGLGKSGGIAANWSRVVHYAAPLLPPAQIGTVIDDLFKLLKVNQSVNDRLWPFNTYRYESYLIGALLRIITTYPQHAEKVVNQVLQNPTTPEALFFFDAAVPHIKQDTLNHVHVAVIKFFTTLDHNVCFMGEKDNELRGGPANLNPLGSIGLRDPNKRKEILELVFLHYSKNIKDAALYVVPFFAELDRADQSKLLKIVREGDDSPNTLMALRDAVFEKQRQSLCRNEWVLVNA